MLFLSDAGIYLSTTRGSKLDIDIIIELEGIFYQMLNESKRWEKTEKIPIEIVQKIERLTTLSSSLVIKIKRGKDTEPEFFNVVLQLGQELIKFSKNISIVIPIAVWADIIMSN